MAATAPPSAAAWPCAEPVNAPSPIPYRRIILDVIAVFPCACVATSGHGFSRAARVSDRAGFSTEGRFSGYRIDLHCPARLIVRENAQDLKRRVSTLFANIVCYSVRNMMKIRAASLAMFSFVLALVALSLFGRATLPRSVAAAAALLNSPQNTPGDLPTPVSP